MVDTLEGCGRIGRSVWLALEDSQSSAPLQAAGLASRLAQVGSEVDQVLRKEGYNAAKWTDRMDWNDRVWGVISLRFESLSATAFSIGDRQPASPERVASELEDQVASAFRAYIERFPQGSESLHSGPGTDGDAAVGIVAAAARVESALSKLRQQIARKPNVHIALASERQVDGRGSRRQRNGNGIQPKRGFTFSAGGTKVSGGNTDDVETCVIISDSSAAAPPSKKGAPGAGAGRFKFVGADGKPVKTITMHGVECICCSPDGDVALMNPALGKLMGQKSKAAEFDEDAVSARSSDIDGLGDETVMPSLKGRPARPLTTQLALGDLDEPNQTQTVPWHLIALAVAYVAWAVLTRGRHDKT